MADAVTTADLIMARLRTFAAPMMIIDGEPTTTPPSYYACVYFDPGLAEADRLAAAGGSQLITWTLTVVCAGRTRDGCRIAVNKIRAALTDWQIDDHPTTGMLRQIGAGPEQYDGPQDDRRISKALIFRNQTARS